MTWTLETSQGHEAAKIRWDAMPYVQGKGLDLGCGTEKIFPHAIGVDQVQGADLQLDASDLSIFATGSLDYVFSSHLLEHVVDYRATLLEWWRVVKVGGYLVLYLPHRDFYPRCGQPGANPDHKHDFLPNDILRVLIDRPALLVESEERNDGNEYSFFLVLQKCDVGALMLAPPKPEKTAIVWRCGAYGDMLHAASICAGLKDQGFHVTLYTRRPFSDVVRHDPHIDRLIELNTSVQADGLIGTFPTSWAGDCWRHLERACDRFVNLGYVVETQLLILPNQPARTWSHEFRHAQCNRNYLEFQETAAGLPHHPQVRFYPTDEEVRWAKGQCRRLTDRIVVWALRGTGVNKYWPFLAPMWSWLTTTYPDITLILSGDASSLAEAAPWKEQPRLLVACDWTMRQTMAFAQQADLVIGPETGVLHAVCQESMPKIIFLSHSSDENLTRDWVNTIALSSNETPCYPCHLMHDSFADCPRPTKTAFVDYLTSAYPALSRDAIAPSEEGDWNVSACQFGITLDVVRAAISTALSTAAIHKRVTHAHD